MFFEDHNKSKPRLVILDMSFALKTSIAVHPDFTHEGVYTGGFFGFVKQVCSCMTTLKADSLIICKDTPPYERKKRFPDYKANRVRSTDEEMNLKYKHTNEQIEEFLSCTNIPVWGVPGAEADDLIAKIVAEKHKDYDKVIAKSSDGDLKQLFAYENFYMQKQKVLYGRSNFEQDYPGLSPEDMIKLDALTGTHNNVNGISKVGPKTALKIILDPKKYATLLEENSDLIDRNMDLIQIPDARVDYEPVPEIPLVSFKSRKIIKIFDKLGIKYEPMYIKAFG